MEERPLAQPARLDQHAPARGVHLRRHRFEGDRTIGAAP
jgi:hypothetical protein